MNLSLTDISAQILVLITVLLSDGIVTVCIILQDNKYWICLGALLSLHYINWLCKGEIS